MTIKPFQENLVVYNWLKEKKLMLTRCFVTKTKICRLKTSINIDNCKSLGHVTTLLISSMIE